MVQHGSSLNTVHTTCKIPCASCKSNVMEEELTQEIPNKMSAVGI